MRALLFLFAIAAAAQTGPAYRFITDAGPAQFIGLGADAAGNTYVVSDVASGLSIVKLDPNGVVLNRTAFGDSNVQARAVAVDPAGDVFITGVTYDTLFPTTKGAWLTTPPASTPNGYQGLSFLLRLNPDGSLGYSTWFSNGATIPNSLALGADGSAYIAGPANFPAALPVTPGAYQSTCGCGLISTGFVSTGLLAIPVADGFMARFDPTGSQLLFATYLGRTIQLYGPVANHALAVAPDGSAYVGGEGGVLRLNSSGSALLASMTLPAALQALAVGPDGTVYLASPALRRLDANLTTVLQTRAFGGPSALPYSIQVDAMTTDASGNVYLAGYTSARGLPTVTPINQAFGSPETGFLSKLSPDLSSLEFSGYFGDTEYFGFRGLTIGLHGDVIAGGSTADVWVNSVTVTPPPALRLDSVFNAASLVDDPLSGGETVVVNGAGFTNGAQLLIGGIAATTLSVQLNQLIAVIPNSLSGSSARVQVQSAGANSNSVLVPLAAASPGIFSQDGTGFGQGYIVNQDGSLNSPSHPASPGDRITLYATGIGPVDFIDGYAQTTTPVNVFIDFYYCAGVAAIMNPVAGFPGDLYQLTVYVPNPPNLKFPAQSMVVLNVAGGGSQAGLVVSIAQ